MLLSPAVLRRATASCLDSLFSACCSVSLAGRRKLTSRGRLSDERLSVWRSKGGRRTDPVNCLGSRTNKRRKSTVTIAKSLEMLLEFSSMGLRYVT